VSGARSDWPIRRYRLGREPSDDVSDVTTAEERLQMMWRMACEGWTLAGRALPAYRPSARPSRPYRPGEQRDDE
jgi:hypothetical protein